MRTSDREGRRPRLLYVAFYFPPTRASGVYRSRAVANHFAAAGWDVTVITPQREFFRDHIHSFDPTLETTLRPEIRIERVPFSGDLWDPCIRAYSALRVYAPRLWRTTWKWRNTREFPEVYAPWIEPAVQRALDLHANRPFDGVIATGNPFAALAVAWHLHRRAQIPYVVDYRDSWTLNLFTEQPAFPPHHPAWKWEERIISDATGVLFVNEALREWHADRYPDAADRMLVVENGWDPDILGELRLPRQAGASVRFGYIGTMMRQMPLAEFLAGWAVAKRDNSFGSASAHLFGYLGYFPGGSHLFLDHIKAAERIGVTYEGPVAKTEIRSIYESLDVLVLMIAGSRFVSSGKVYEYVGTGRPIVSVHEPRSAASAILRDYPLWVPAASLAPDDIAAALISAADAARTLAPELALKAREHAAELTRDAQLDLLEPVLVRMSNRPRTLAD